MSVSKFVARVLNENEESDPMVGINSIVNTMAEIEQSNYEEGGLLDGIDLDDDIETIVNAMAEIEQSNNESGGLLDSIDDVPSVVYTKFNKMARSSNFWSEWKKLVTKYLKVGRGDVDAKFDEMARSSSFWSEWKKLVLKYMR